MTARFWILITVIVVTCTAVYRSLVACAVLLVPVVLASLLLSCTLLMLDLALDIHTLPILVIGVGIGIDYGIYLLSRICEEYRDAKHYGDAIRMAVATTGKAIFFTATIVLLSILPWYFLSGLKFLADMGLLLVIIMLINMLVALVVLPLLVYLFKPGFIDREHMILSESIDPNVFPVQEAA